MFLSFMLPKFFFSEEGGAGGGVGAGGAGGGAGGAGGGAPAGGTAGGGAPAAPEFSTLIPEGFKEKQWVKETKDLPTLFKRVDDLQSELGKRPSAIPQENAKPEDWEKFNKAFGVPEKPEDYKFSAPPAGLESSAEFQKGVQDILHKAGISARQFKAIEPAWNALMLEMAKNTQAGAQALDQDFDKLANTVFGERKDTALQNAKAMIDKFTPDAVKPHVAKLSNENLIIVAGVLDKIISTYVSEDEIPRGGGGSGAANGEQAIRDEAQKLMLTDAYKNAFDPKHKETVEKVNALYARIK